MSYMYLIMKSTDRLRHRFNIILFNTKHKQEIQYHFYSTGYLNVRSYLNHILT